MYMTDYEKYITLEDLPIVTKVVLPKMGMVRNGVIQFVHGMCEMKERYDRILDFFASHGYVCVISDLRGHGENVEFEKDLGYFGADGAQRLIEDIHAVTIFIKNNYPDLPITLLGHSMGSLIGRAYAKKYDDDIDMLILLGCPSMRRFRNLGTWIIEFVTLFIDEHETNKIINNMVVGVFEKKFAHEGVPNSWICSDMGVVEEFNYNPKCGFMFTLNGHLALCKLQGMVYSKRNWAVNNKRLHIAFFSGEDDPCLLDEETFEKSVDIMRKVGYRNVSAKIYKGMRHEILNEPDYIKVCEDILEILPVA